ncbi:MAG: PTS sugar transporter subunit IIA [Bacteroidetes bacterium]|nr:PTS sugar transporter subunit IIA [Bacteroidota bacterium]
MKIYEILDKSCCSISLEGRNKNSILRELSELAVKNSEISAFSAESVYNTLVKREEEGSTGFGEGVALPHIRLKGLKDMFVLIAVSKHGVDFDAIDKKKVKLFFLIVAPEDKVTEHVQVLAGISRALSAGNLKNELLSAKSQGVLYETFLRSVQQTSGDISQKRDMKLMFIILYLEDMLYHILEYFIQEGIDGATIVESSGMGEYISNIPLFASFIGFMNEKKNRSKTIMAMIPAERQQEILEGIESITGDLDKKEGAMIFVTDITFYKGTMKMLG